MKRNIVFSLLSLLMFSACTKSGEQNQSSAVTDVEVASIRSDLELYDSLEGKEGENQDLKFKLAQSILRHVMLVRTANPKVESLQGEQLETICFLTEPGARKILNEAGDPQLAGLAHDYLSRIEPDVRKKIEEYQKTMKGTGCFLTPNASSLPDKQGH